MLIIVFLLLYNKDKKSTDGSDRRGRENETVSSYRIHVALSTGKTAAGREQNQSAPKRENQIEPKKTERDKKRSAESVKKKREK